MDAKHWITLRVLLNKYHEGSDDAIVKMLPDEHAQKLLQQTVTSGDITPLITNPLEKIKLYHYSWLGPVLEKLSKELQSLTVTAMPEPSSSRLRRMLKLPPEPKILSPPIKQFLIGNLYDHIEKENAIPLEYLPESALEELKTLPKKQLIELIDYLAIFDLAHEVKHIVDKKVWQGLYACLTPVKKRFLELCMKRKKTLAPPKPMLHGWTGDNNRFNKILQLRGLKRLGFALSGENASFVWYLAHRLDTGRGKILLKYYSKKAHPKVTYILQQETHRALKYLNKMSKPRE